MVERRPRVRRPVCAVATLGRRPSRRAPLLAARRHDRHRGLRAEGTPGAGDSPTTLVPQPPHPETGEKALYVNPGFTTHIEGVSAHESRRLLGLFYDELARPEYTVRFKWEPGSIAFWDNRSTVHLAPSDLTTEHARRLYRVTLVADVPQGPDGKPSIALDGDPF